MSTHDNLAEPAPAPPADEPDVNEILGDLWLPMRAYAISLIGGVPHAVDEIIQESAIHIWEHKAQLPEIKNLRAWAFRIVYFKALSFRRNRSGNPLVGFSEEAIEFLAGSIENNDDFFEQRRNTLVECINQLRDKDRVLLTRYYEERYSIKDIAAGIRKKEEAVYKQIARLRRALRLCIERKISAKQTLS